MILEVRDALWLGESELTRTQRDHLQEMTGELEA